MGETLVIGGFFDQLGRRAKGDPRRHEGTSTNVNDTSHELIYKCLPDTTLTFANDAFRRFFERVPLQSTDAESH